MGSKGNKEVEATFIQDEVAPGEVVMDEEVVDVVVITMLIIGPMDKKMRCTNFVRSLFDQATVEKERIAALCTM